jgi:two-component system, chemotaxis family, protein-glutamate methylesterase/glutaminase
MAHRGIVVVGASAGGVEALGRLVASLPEDLHAAVLVVLHIPSEGTSLLPSILSRQGPLPAAHAQSGQRVRHGRIYVAPPNRHLMLHDGLIRLSSGPHENGHRPAVDVLFRSAARAAGPAAIGVVLSGALDDGTAGLAAIKTRGGVTVAQEPEDALYPAMPLSAIEQVGVDHVVRADAVGELLSALTKEPLAGDEPPLPDAMQVEVQMAEMTFGGNEARHPGRPSGFSCPDCNGVLWEIEEDQIFRFRCRVGHEWSPEGLLAQQNDGIEAALWIALRSLEERGSLSRRMAKSAEDRGHQISAGRFQEHAEEAEHGAALLRALLADPGKLTGGITLLGDARRRADAGEGVGGG